MSDAPPGRAPPVAEPMRPLDYAPPVDRARRSTLIGGIIISAAYAFGFGMIAYGLMLGWRNDREAPEFFAAGVASNIFASGVIVTLWLARR